MPFFSIILPTYNRATFIGKAIESVLNQTYTDFELIIIDDGSKDNTKEVAGKFKDIRLSYYFQENQERSVARNYGMQKSKGQYICFLDSDDYYLPEHLTILYNIIKKNNFSVALFHTYQNYKITGKESTPVYFDDYKSDEITAADCRLINNVWLFSPAVQTIAIHRDISSTILFDSTPIPFECYEFIGRIAATYNVIKIKERTVMMQIHENNSTTYNIKFLEDSKNAFQYILSNPIYKNLKKHFSVKEKFYSIYIGLADCYSTSGNKSLAIKYLYKALANKTNLINIRHILGILRNLVYTKKSLNTINK